MPLTDEEFEKMASDNCPACKAGSQVRFRENTFEFVHDYAKGVPGGLLKPSMAMSHQLCLSNGMRNARRIGNG